MFLKEIYPSQLTVEKANKSDQLANLIDLTFMKDSGGKLSTRPYDKRDDFQFHCQISIPFQQHAMWLFIWSQLIRYARCCSHYDDFSQTCLVDQLLSYSGFPRKRNHFVGYSLLFLNNSLLFYMKIEICFLYKGVSYSREPAVRLHSLTT